MHVWSGFAAIGYLFRPYQIARSRRLNVPAGHNLPAARRAPAHEEPLMEAVQLAPDASRGGEQPSINGVLLIRLVRPRDMAELRQRACVELLRQAAIEAGMLGRRDIAPADGVISEAASVAIDAWLERELQLPEPSEEACMRH